jgi:hypothetical protein
MLIVPSPPLSDDKSKRLSIESATISADDFTPDSNDAVGWYNENAEAIIERQASLAPETV